jgi:hypothetical protein
MNETDNKHTQEVGAEDAHRMAALHTQNLEQFTKQPRRGSVSPIRTAPPRTARKTVYIGPIKLKTEGTQHGCSN